VGGAPGDVPDAPNLDRDAEEIDEENE